MAECLIVGIGGFIGAVCRYLIGLIPISEGCVFPVKTFAINIIGSFLIGVIAALAVKNNFFNPKMVLFLKDWNMRRIYNVFFICTGNG